MRRIIPQTEIEKKETRKKVIIGIVLVAIMVFSTAGYSFFSGSGDEVKQIKYNNIEFVLNDAGRWQFELQNRVFSTYYNPEETSNISVPIFKMVNSYSGLPLFFVGNSLATQEIAVSMQGFVPRMQEVCIQSIECIDESLPIKNCSQDNVIIFQEAENMKIEEDEKCVFIRSPAGEEEKAADAFLFKILGI